MRTSTFCFISLLMWTATACNQSRSSNYEYATSEIIRFKSDNITLEGVLDLPASDHKLPLIVFVHGSGRATRGDYSHIIPRLNEAGFATFRYDKRGVGQSEGIFLEVGTWNSVERINVLASDAASAIKHLRNHDRIDPSRIIVMGGSQAGWIIPVVCSLADVSMSVCISGPTVSVGEEIYYSELAENHLHTQEHADEMLKDFRGPHGFDNIAYIAKMSKPSLWIFGGKDVSIPVRKCLSRLDSVRQAAALPVDTRLYNGADHGIFNTGTGRMEDYVSEVVEWLRSRQ